MHQPTICQLVASFRSAHDKTHEGEQVWDNILSPKELITNTKRLLSKNLA